VSGPESSPAAPIALTRPEKEKLLQQMYSRAHWIAIIRLFGYQAMPMDKARQEIKPLAEEFGKEPVANACEALVEISVQGKDSVARLKPHIRLMAFQILGPEQPAETNDSTATTAPSTPNPNPKTASPQPPEKKKRKKPAGHSAPSAATMTSGAPTGSQSAIMQQYRAAKEKHPDMLLLFRMGDFYELFDQDAETAHKLLGLTLTTRDRTLTMAGFPHHQLETYLHKLLKEGQRVAVCEPVDESLVRGPIRREVTRVVTPGTPVEDGASNVTKRQPMHDAPNAEGRAVRQPRHFVLKQFEAWLNEAGLAFVAAEDVRRTTPAVKPYVGVLDFIVLRGETKLLVAVRPHLQAKHLKAIGELQNIFGPEYKPMRIWPTEGPDGWIWQDHPVDVSAVNVS
jgi:hypothetical protein